MGAVLINLYKSVCFLANVFCNLCMVLRLFSVPLAFMLSICFNYSSHAYTPAKASNIFDLPLCPKLERYSDSPRDRKEDFSNCYGEWEFGEGKYIGGFDKGKYNGYGSLEFYEGGTYTGFFVSGKRQGQGFSIFYTGNYKGEFKNDSYNGKGFLTITDGEVCAWGMCEMQEGYEYDGYFLNGLKHGEGIATYKNGVVKKGIYYLGEYIPEKCENLGLIKGTSSYGQCITRYMDKTDNEVANANKNPPSKGIPNNSNQKSSTINNRKAKGVVTIKGLISPGKTVYIDKSSVTDPDGIGKFVHYKWLTNGIDLNEGRTTTGNPNATSYIINDNDLGKTLSVQYTFYDGSGNLETLVSKGYVVKYQYKPESNNQFYRPSIKQDCPPNWPPPGLPKDMPCPVDASETVMVEHIDRKNRLLRLSKGSIKPDFYTEYLAPDEHKQINYPVDIPVLRVTFDTDVFFDTAKSEIKTEAFPVLRIISDNLAKEPADVALYIVGHTDSTGGSASNYNLGLKRANKVAEAISRRGFYNASIYRLSLGEGAPIADNRTVIGRAKNRRVEFLFGANAQSVESFIKRIAVEPCIFKDEKGVATCRRPVNIEITKIEVNSEMRSEVIELNRLEAELAMQSLSTTELNKKRKAIEIRRERIAVDITIPRVEVMPILIPK